MSNDMKIVIGCDHAAPDMKNDVKAELIKMGFEVTDVGTHSTDSCDYPDIAHALCEKITDGSHRLGILICGTGIGMSIAANKVKGIRAACCSDIFSARYTRLHNDANALCLGARVVGEGLAEELATVFVETGYEGIDGGKHARRVGLITEIENKN